MIFCTSECSPNFFLYCITTDPFRKGFCQKKKQIITGCDAHAPEAPDVVPLLRETQARLPGLGTEGSDSLPGLG